MRRVAVLVPIIIAVLIFSSAPRLANAQSVSPTAAFSASLSSGDTSVSIALQASQNLTFLDRFFSLPQFAGRLVGQNASAILAQVQASIEAQSSRASVTDLSLSLASSPPTDGTTLQWFNVSLQFHLSGIQIPENGNEKTDMSWKSFVISSNVTVGAVEVNAIGNAYMRDASSFLASLEAPTQGTSSGTSTYRNLVNDRVVTAVGLPSAFSKIELLNFTRLLPQIDTWTRGYDSASRSTTWSMNTIPVLGLSVQEKINEPSSTQTTQTVNSGVFYTIQATIFAPARSFAQGDSIVVVFQDTSETIMGVAIVSVLALGFVSYLYESRFLRGRDRRKPKR